MAINKLGSGGFNHLGAPLGAVGVPAVAGTAMDFAGGASAPSVTRTASATYWNSSGVLSTAAANTGRIQYDSLSRERLGLLIEDSTGSNLFLNSNAADNAYWIKSSATVTANTNEVTDPAGGNAADIILEVAATANHGFSRTVTISAPASDITVTEYFILKARDRNRVVILGSGKSTVQCVVDLTNGAIDPAFSSVSANLIGAYAEPIGGGWVLCALQFVVAAAATTYQSIVRLVEVSSGQITSYLGDATKGVYHYHAQSRIGAQFDMPIFTTASALTRDQDVSSQSISSWWSATKASLVFEGRSRRVSGQSIVAQLDDGSENNRIRFWRDAAGEGRLLITSGGVDQLNIDLGAWGDDADRALAVAFKSGEVRYSMNGGAVSSSALATPPVGLTTWRDGLDSAGIGACTIVRRRAAYAAVLPDATLRSYSLKRVSGSIYMPGDSITAGSVTGQTDTGTYPILLSNLMSRRTFNAGVGGQTSTQILARVQAELDHLNWIMILDAGRNDGNAQSTILANIASMVAVLPSNNQRYGVLSIPFATGDVQATKDYIAAQNAALLAAYPSNFINLDWTTVTRVADGLHPDDAGLLTIAQAVQAFIVAKGW
jgi:lysophospholipase L1-like esterase